MAIIFVEPALLNGTNTSFGKPASTIETEQSTGYCSTWKLSLVILKVEEGHGADVTMQTKQKSIM